MNIIQAIKHTELLRGFLADKNGKLTTWLNWMAVLRALYGLPIPDDRREFIAQVTGRDVDRLPKQGFDTALFLTGRRSGKSRISACISAYSAILAGNEEKLAPGEVGICPIISPTKKQSTICKNYLRAIFKAPVLAREVIAETKDGFTLKNDVKIDILTGDFRSVRGYTLLGAAIVDEAAFLGIDDESSTRIKSDTEIINALEPGLMTTRGKLIAITTPYAKRGWCYTTYKRNFGNDAGRVLVVNAASRDLNPLLDPAYIDAKMAEDRSKSLAEYYGQFRDDVGEVLPRAVIEACVVKGRITLSPERNIRYTFFADLSSGAGKDSAAACVCHRAGRTIIVDRLMVVKPPFSPNAVIRDFCDEAKRYGCRLIQADHFSPGFVDEAIRANGLGYLRSDKNKSELYLEAIPKISSAEVELLDNDLVVNQLANLERRTRSGGRDVIDHPANSHDDAANAAAGAIYYAFQSGLLHAGVF